MIDPEDLEAAARETSENRLADLYKEYGALIPSLRILVRAVAEAGAEMTIEVAKNAAARTQLDTSTDSKIRQDLEVHSDPNAVLKTLYGVGFIGVLDDSVGRYVFCHDGLTVEDGVASARKVMVHPCYWPALSFSHGVSPEIGGEIDDEREIKIQKEGSPEPTVRNARIEGLLQQLGSISSGPTGARAFEDWLFEALRLLCAGGLTNLEKHPNKDAPQQRDIVGTVSGTSPFWRRASSFWGVQQMVFEAKNYDELGSADFQQVNSYLTGEFGRLAFVVTRAQQPEPSSAEIVQIRSYWARQPPVLIAKVPVTYLTKALKKIRNPANADYLPEQLSKLLDTYIRTWLQSRRF